jgi:hypothetical protein
MFSGTSVGRADVRTSSGILYITNEISDQDALEIEKRQEFLKDHFLLFEVAAALIMIVSALYVMRLIKKDRGIARPHDSETPDRESFPEG